MPDDARLPDEATCRVCGWADPAYDGIRDRLTLRGYTEYQMPQLFCRCAAQAEQERLESDRRRAEANFPRAPGDRTFRSFKRVPGTEEAFSFGIRFARGRLTTPCLVLIGDKGSGKTHLLEAIGDISIRQGGTVRYELVKELLDRLRGTYSHDSDEDASTLLNYYQDVGLLLLDDLGMEAGTPYARQQVTAIVDYRYRNGRPLVVSTNQTQDEVAEHMGGRVADRLWDYRSGRVQQVHLTSESYRTRKVVA